MKNTKLAALLVAGSMCVASWHAFAGWDQVTVDVGGMPGANLAISKSRAVAYIPLLQQGALVAFDGERAARLDFDIRPTAIGYSDATGRLFVAGGFDNAVVVVDEATGHRTRLSVGAFPTQILVDDARGKAYTPNWGGITAQGGLSIIDTATLAVRNVSLPGYVSSMAQDSSTGNLFLMVSPPTQAGTTLVALDADGNELARQEQGYQAYSLAVDSRTGHVYTAGLSHAPYAEPDTVTRIFRVYAQPGLRLVTRHDWPAGTDWYKLNFAIDPERPGLYFASGGNTMIFRVNAAGHDLQAWSLPLGTTSLEDGRVVPNGIFGIDADPGTGNLFLSSPTGRFVAEFDARLGTTDIMPIEGAVGFTNVHFWPDGSRILVPDGAGDFNLTLFHRTPAQD